MKEQELVKSGMDIVRRLCALQESLPNKQTPGTCAYCDEESDRLFEPPLLDPYWPDVEQNNTNSYLWHAPGSGYPGKSLYNGVMVNERQYLRPYETPDQPVCWECYAGHICPAEAKYLANKPKEFRLNGWKKPVWLDP